MYHVYSVIKGNIVPADSPVVVIMGNMHEWQRVNAVSSWHMTELINKDEQIRVPYVSSAASPPAGNISK